MSGWLVLESITVRDHGKISFFDIDYAELDYSTLQRIYKFFCEVDLFNAKEALKGELEGSREMKEDEWNEKLEERKTLRDNLNGQRELIQLYGSPMIRI